MKARPAPRDSQATFLYPDLIDQLNPKDPLLQLAARIPWDRLEAEFAPLHATRGRPAKPVRLMAGLLLLKQLANLSDERVVEEWRQNPCFQAFCGMKKLLRTIRFNRDKNAKLRKMHSMNMTANAWLLSLTR